MANLPAIVSGARAELGLPALAPIGAAGGAGAPIRTMTANAVDVGMPPISAHAGDVDIAPRLDRISETLRSLGGKVHTSANALADIANGTANVLSRDAVAAAAPRQAAASAMLGAMFVEGAQMGEAHLPRAPRMEGNNATLLVRNANYLPRLYADLESATKSITVNQYNWEPDGSGEKVLGILREKAKAGLDVRVVIDGYGMNEKGKEAGLALKQSLEAAGVKFAHTDGMKPGGTGWEHRKLITVDDRVAYMGGLGFGAKYDTWTDLMTRIEGPAAAIAATSVLGTHRELSGQGDATITDRLRSLDARIQDALQGPRQGAQTVAEQADAARSAPIANATAAVTLLENRAGQDLAATEAFLRDVASAKDRLWATSTYITTDVAAKALMDASKRGVDVKLLVTSPEAGNDSKQIHLGRALYQEMLKSGVEVFEWPGILHSKSWVRDDDVAAVGSMNLSKSSMARAREIMARVEDPAFAKSYADFHAETRKGAHQVKAKDVDKLDVHALGLLGKLGLQF